MRNTRILFSLLVTSALLNDIQADGIVTSASECTNKTKEPMRVTMRHIEGNGVGYDQGYSTLEGFFTLPCSLNGSWIPFLDVRGHIFNNGKPAANAGLGLRYAASRIWGINTYYDYRKTSHLNYNQISMGLESLGRLLDFRINGYLPVGQKSEHYGTKMDGFKGNHLILSRKKEFDMKGANGEMGVHITNNKYAALYAAAGPYYLDYKGINAWGGELRLALDVTDYFRIEGNTSYDNIFNWIAQGQFSVNIPFGGKKTVSPKKGRSCKNQGIMATRALQKVDRNEIIVVDKKTQKRNAMDPTTGQPYVFIFVDNTSHSNGSYESPYHTLTAAQDASLVNNIIYVYPGNGTTSGMDAGIALKDNQRLLSSSFDHVVNTTWGAFTIAASTSALPQITNLTVAGNVIQLANNNEISGFKIFNNNAGGDGITTGSRASTQNLLVTHNIIAGDDHSSAYGVSVIGTTGNVAITENSFEDQSIAMLIEGFSIENADYLVSKNSITSSSTGMFIYFSDCGNMNTSILENTISTTNANLQYDQTNTSSTLQNSLVVGNNSLTSTFSNVTTTIAGAGNLDVTISDNTITGYRGLNQALSDSSVVTVTMDNNIVNSGDTASNITASGTVNLTATISGNTMESTTGDGCSNTFTDSAIVALTINNNTLRTHAIGAANRIASLDDVTLTATISDNTVTSTLGGGFFQTFYTSSVGTLVISRNNINVAIFGLALTENDAANVTYSVSNNTITNSSGSAVFLRYSDFSVVSGNISDNIIAAAGSCLLSRATDQANLTYVISDNDLTSAINSTINISGVDLTVTSATVENNTISSGLYGIALSNVDVDLSATPMATYLVTGNTFNALGNSGVYVNNSANSTVTSTILNNTFTEVPVAGLPYTLVSASDSALECVKFQGNKVSPVPTASENDFEFAQAGGSTFNLVNPTLNVGYITKTGTINTVSSCE